MICSVDPNSSCPNECDQCDYNVSKKDHLINHKQTVHEGLRYGCDGCDYQATQKGTLQMHKQSIHEGVRYNCDECDYKATQKGSLKNHKNIHQVRSQ